MMRSAILRTTAYAALSLALMLANASAQQGTPNALQGFSQNKDKPVQIEAASLEVRDKDKVATFSGAVNVTQGDTNMRCQSLLVFYDTDGKDKDAKSSSTMKAAQPGPGGNSSIKRLEAKGGVVVTQKDQTATGETGIFDMKSNTITLAGKVTVTQGQNVLRGDKLIVDMTTGAARVESGGGRVQGLFVPNNDKDSKDKDSKDKDGKDKDKDGKGKESGKDTKAKDAGKDSDSSKAKESGKGTDKGADKAKEASKDKIAAKPVDVARDAGKDASKSIDKPKNTAKNAAKNAGRNPPKTNAAKDDNEEEAAPVRPAIRNNTAPETVPATRDTGTVQERSRAIAPRGIY